MHEVKTDRAQFYDALFWLPEVGCEGVRKKIKCAFFSYLIFLEIDMSHNA